MVSHMSHEMVEFAYFRPSAQSVHLAGEFNPSQMDRVAMDRDDRGSWRVRIPLDPGEYRYQYLVDDSLWEADFGAHGNETDPSGDWTSVVRIPLRADVTRSECLPRR